MKVLNVASNLYKSLTLCLFFAIITRAQDLCVTKSTCHECIQTVSCAWCNEMKFEHARCFEPSYPGNKTCPEEYIYNPHNERGFISNLGLTRSKLHGSSASSSFSEKEWGVEGVHSDGAGVGVGAAFGAGGITQIRPQWVNLKLRMRQVYKMDMYYTQAEDYPVDLYYLMDLSKSMEDDKEKLSDLGDKLAQTMQNITSNFKLGFGSFVDKVVMPYVSTIPTKLQHPCPGCVAPYGFQNHLPLSSNTNQFSYMVREASVSGNLDGPEGGFDAIMQAVVCRDNIGWRQQARRLLVFSTDAGFHYAGDGKLGGIVQPNDGSCHLDSNGYYNMSSSQDYPSVSQINLFVKKNAINVIFAVTSEKFETYQRLQSHIEGASSAVLSDDSSNIVELIQGQYEAIQSTVEMIHNASSAVGIKFFSSCLDPDSPPVETHKCSGMKVGKLVKFSIELEVLKCPKDPKDWKQKIRIYPVGMNESLMIDLEMLCDCPCERPSDPNYLENAEECHYRGTLMCGICDCKKGSVGRFCECLSNTVMSNLTQYCTSPINGLICSGRGECNCGQCNCKIRKLDSEKVTGKHCECDNFSCERRHGKLCSGHGECICGKCVCAPGWTGLNCACTTSTATCIAPGTTGFGNDTICSGKGRCVCGKCHCSEKDRLGNFCERCPGCSDKCEEFKECVQCQQYHTGPKYNELDTKKCASCPITPIPAKTIEVNETNNEHLCAFYDEDDCRYTFVYYYTTNKTIEIRAQEERECPHKVFLLGVILAVIAAVVLLGLAILLLWKLLTTIHDRREFARFEKERMMAKWDTGENPIYKQATSTFKNPTYAGKG